MSTPSQTSVVSSSHPSYGCLAWTGLLTVVVALVINTVIALSARTLFAVAPAFLPLQPVALIPTTVAAVAGAVIVFGLLMRWSQQPKRLFVRIAVIVLAISLLPDVLLLFVPLYPGATIAGVGTLMLMHVLTGLLCLGTLTRMNA